MNHRAPRAVHPGAWWLWALGLSTAASRTTNPLLLGLILVVVWHVVTARRSDAPWASAFTLFLKLGLVVITIRVVAQVIFGTAGSGAVLLELPEVSLPSWAAGITLGGAVTLETLMAAVTDGLRLATMLACLGAANALANAKRLLASLPAALYEVGVAIVVALSFAPSMVTATQRIRRARRLRGRSSTGLRGIASVAMPVLEDAFERSLALAAAMDSRGYGRRVERSVAARRLTATLTLGGLTGTTVGVFALLDGGASPLVSGLALGGGLLIALTGLTLSGRRTVRSRYRPDPWRLPEWITMAAGVSAAAAVIVTGAIDFLGLWPPAAAPTAWSLPPLAAAGVLVGLLPAWATPPPPRSAARRTPPPTDRPASTSTSGPGATVAGGPDPVAAATVADPVPSAAADPPPPASAGTAAQVAHRGHHDTRAGA